MQSGLFVTLDHLRGIFATLAGTEIDDLELSTLRHLTNNDEKKQLT